MDNKYVIGIDYGTLSGRSVLVSCRDGSIKASAVKSYAHGVMDEFLPGRTVKLPPDFALEHPQDYLDVLESTIPAILKESGVNKQDIIGIGIDFTSCTMLPIDEIGVPLCFKPEWKDHPHSYVKLWKHHSAQKQADQINRILEEYNLSSEPRFGGRVSPELMIPKIMETFQCDRKVYDEAAEFLEAGDWLTRILTGSRQRSCSMAGYKAWWLPESRYPDLSFYEKIDSGLRNIISEKMNGNICGIGRQIGQLNEEWAKKLGLMPKISVAASIIDSHAGVPGSGICNKNQMMLVVGTSSVMVALSESSYAEKGICGAFKGGIVPGYYALESGLAAVGDTLGWFVDNCVPESYVNSARQKGIGIHDLLIQKASAYTPGQSGLLALDWWNGNKTPYVDGELTGVILGLNLRTKPEEIYRALIESTAYGTRMIMEIFENAGVPIKEIIASGGIANKNPLFMQIYADVLGKPVKLADSDQTAALGSAIYAALAAGKGNGGYDSYEEAVLSMSGQKELCYLPNQKNAKIYDLLYDEYCKAGKKMKETEDCILHHLHEISMENRPE